MAAEFLPYDPTRYPPHSEIALRLVKVWCLRAFEGSGQALVLWSSAKAENGKGNGYGNGKTMLAKCAANALYAVLETKLGLPDISGRFMTTDAFLSDIKDSYDQKTTHQFFGQLHAARFLVLDDFGTEHATDLGWLQEQFFKVLNYAYDAKQPLLLTSNLTPADMQARLGGKNWSRLHGLAGGEAGFVNMSMIPDQRKAKTK